MQIGHEVLVSGGSPVKVHTAGSEHSGVKIDNLQPETAYSFQVRAVSSSEGKSAWSTPLTGITLPLRTYVCIHTVIPHNLSQYLYCLK